MMPMEFGNSKIGRLFFLKREKGREGELRG